MKSALIAVAACALLAACASDHPAPGEAPGWDQPGKPFYRPAAGQVDYLAPVPDGHNVPYGVRGEAVSPEGNTLGDTANPDQGGCQKIPTTMFEGRPTSTICRQPDGNWTFIPD